MREGKIKLGLIGCGQMGNYYAHNLKKKSEAEIVVCCDPSENKMKAFMEKWSITEGRVDWRELFDPEAGALDGIINCTVDSLHQDIFTSCLRNRLPLFTEKPLAVPPKVLASFDRERLKALLFVINFSKRTIPAVAGAYEFVKGGGLGHLSRLEFHYRQGWLFNRDFGNWRDTSAWFWRLTNRYSHYGVLGDLGSHLFDLALLFGGGVHSVSCRIGRSPKVPGHHRGEVLDSFDDAFCTLEYGSGALGLVSVSRTTAGMKDGMEILVSGENGSIRLNPEESKDSYEYFAAGHPVSEGWERVDCLRRPQKNLDVFIGLLSGEELAGYPGLEASVENELLIGAAVRSAAEGKGTNMNEYREKMMGGF